jgi:hypothetical protein
MGAQMVKEVAKTNDLGRWNYNCNRFSKAIVKGLKTLLQEQINGFETWYRQGRKLL